MYDLYTARPGDRLWANSDQIRSRKGEERIEEDSWRGQTEKGIPREPTAHARRGGIQVPAVFKEPRQVNRT